METSTALAANDNVSPVLNTQAALVNFVKLAQELVDKHYATHPWKRVLSVEPGRRYARIVIQDEHDGVLDAYSRSVYCFVDMTNGDVLKSESWKKPAKHARGNIFNENPVKGCGPYGAAYLK
jgi:hypothetical protein